MYSELGWLDFAIAYAIAALFVAIISNFLIGFAKRRGCNINVFLSEVCTNSFAIAVFPLTIIVLLGILLEKCLTKHESVTKMDNDFKYAISGVVLLVCTTVAIALFGRAACVADKATFGAIENELDRKNFEQSQSYREGLRRDFDELIISYSRAKSDDERATILAVMRHRAAGAPPEAVPADVKKFIADHTGTQK